MNVALLRHEYNIIVSRFALRFHKIYANSQNSTLSKFWDFHKNLDHENLEPYGISQNKYRILVIM